MTAIDSMSKVSFSESLPCLVEEHDVFSEVDEVYETPNDFNELVGYESNEIPDDVLNIDNADDDMFQYRLEIIKYKLGLSCAKLTPQLSYS